MSNYFTFWHITEPVFVRPGADAALFETDHVRDMCARLLDFAGTHQPLAVLTGAPGGGKTTMLRWLADTLPMTSHDVLLLTLLNREANAGWFLPRLAHFFRTKPQAGSAASPTEQWKAVLVTGINQLAAENRHLVVCIDAAHLIATDEAMSDLEAFFNLQDHVGQRVSVLLSGAPELAERIKNLPSLALRVSRHLEVKPLERSELESYIAWHLKRAGITAAFEADTLTAVYRQSGGNLLATGMALEKCLIEAAARDSRRITPFVSEKALGGVPQKKTVDELFAEKKDSMKDVKEKSPEQFPPKVVAEQVSRAKNETDKASSIKLSSLFKQDDD
jgi:type II secretory pathway predicted ATPase ExeA